MKEPEKKSSEDVATPRKDRKKPASSAVVENRAVEPGTPAAATVAEAKPMIESTLVGAGSDRPAAARRDSAPTAPAAETATSPVPPVSRPDPAATATPAKPVPPASAATATPVSRPDTKVEAKPAPKVEVRKVGFFPTFLGGVVAAGLGAGATYWAIPHLPPEWRPGAVEAVSPEAQLEAARQAAVEAARAEVSTQADALSTRAAEAGADAARQALADAQSKQPAAAVAAIPAELNDKIAALETGLAALSNRPAAAASTASTATPQPAPQPAGVSQAALDELAKRVSDQQARIDELAARPVVDPATAKQVQGLMQQTEQLQESTQQATRRAQAATAAAALRAAIEEGAARDEAVAGLSAAGITVAPVLTGDIPRLETLRAEFAPAAREGLRVSLDAVAQNEGAMSKIGNFLRVQTGARSVEPREGNDPDAVLSRANAAVEAGDIKGALAEIATLPEAGQQAMSAWTGQAKTWVEANAALADLAASVK